MATNKRMNELLGLTKDLVPTPVDLSERKPKEFKHSATQQIDSITGRDRAEARAEEAEAKVAALLNELEQVRETGNTGSSQDHTDRINDLLRQLEEATATRGSLELPLADLHEVEGRRRSLTTEQYNELKENLRNNPLIAPVSVRVRPAGGLEIVSGHNRVAAFRELGRSTISAVIISSDDEQVDEGAFYANLLQPNLPDYEKFLGFKMLQARHPGLTQKEIAAKAGTSEQLISAVMSFEKLPREALDLLEANKNVIGANTAQALVLLAKKGREGHVVEAIQRVIAGMDQAQALKLAASGEAKSAAVVKVTSVKYTVGKSAYCELRRANTTLRVDFKSAEEAEAVEKLVKDLLSARTEQLKSPK